MLLTSSSRSQPLRRATSATNSHSGIVASANAEIRRDVLDRELATEGLLDRSDARRNVRERFLGVRQGQQVVEMAPADTAPAQVLGDERGLDPIGEALQLGDVPVVERVGRPERHADAVQRYRIVGAQILERRDRRPAVGEIVLAVDFEPGNGGPLGPHAADVRASQPDAGCDGKGAVCAPRGSGRANCRPGRDVSRACAQAFGGAALPPILSHSPLFTYFHSVGSLSALAP